MNWAPPAPFPDDRYAGIADAVARVLGTANDVVLVHAEAVVALEATASSLAGPGIRALNVVTSPYGDLFGAWLRRGGAEVTDVRAVAPGAIEIAPVAAALEAGDVDIVALVHGEAASGILNPLPELAALVRSAGALLVVDAVASAGAHPVDADALGLDVVVVGPQKALDGPASLSAVSASPRAWEAMERRESARGGPGAASVLSLLDQRRDWIVGGRGALPGTPDTLSFHALADALGRLEAEGLGARIARHAAASTRARQGVAALGVTPFPADPARASGLVTAFELPSGTDRTETLRRLRAVDPSFSAAVGPATDRLVRLQHTGHRARPEVVDAALDALRAELTTTLDR